MENDPFDVQSYTKMQNLIRWKSGKRVDPKLLALLESFGEMYVERRELFKRVFEEKYEELFEKIGEALRRRKQMKKGRKMVRSMSMRAIGKRGIGGDEIEGLRLERFKVKTPVVMVEDPIPGDAGQTQTAQGSSKDSK